MNVKMKKIIILIICLSGFNYSYCQDVKILQAKIDGLEKRIENLEKMIKDLRQSQVGSTDIKSPHNIKYELFSEDKSTDFLITYWDKDGKTETGWFKSGWKYLFSTLDLNQQIIVQAKPGIVSKKDVTVNVFVDNKLIKTDTKRMYSQMDGPSCQVFLTDL